jgi:hypothetical protein
LERNRRQFQRVRSERARRYRAGGNGTKKIERLGGGALEPPIFELIPFTLASGGRRPASQKLLLPSQMSDVAIR